jgi:hypothetical protein
MAAALVPDALWTLIRPLLPASMPKPQGSGLADYFRLARHPAAGGREPPNPAFPCSGCWTTVAGPVADSTVRAPRG